LSRALSEFIKEGVVLVALVLSLLIVKSSLVIAWTLFFSERETRMGRQPCCDKVGLKKGPWTAEEDKKLINFILTNGQCCWRAVPKLAGLLSSWFLCFFVAWV